MGTQETNSSQKTKTPEKYKCIGVTSRPDTFRRGGLSFTSEETIVELAALTAVQVRQIRTEKKLVVRDTTVTADKINVRKAV